MKDLTVYLSILIEENNDDGSHAELYGDNLYLALPPEHALDALTEDFLVASAKRLMVRALAQAKKEYQPELEVSE